jgi:hypothetical protein
MGAGRCCFLCCSSGPYSDPLRALLWCSPGRDLAELRPCSCGHRITIAARVVLNLCADSAAPARRHCSALASRSSGFGVFAFAVESHPPQLGTPYTVVVAHIPPCVCELHCLVRRRSPPPCSARLFVVVTRSRDELTAPTLVFCPCRVPHVLCPRRRVWEFGMFPCSAFTASASSFVCGRASAPSRHPALVLDKKTKRVIMPLSSSNGNHRADMSMSPIAILVYANKL